MAFRACLSVALLLLAAACQSASTPASTPTPAPASAKPSTVAAASPSAAPSAAVAPASPVAPVSSPAPVVAAAPSPSTTTAAVPVSASRIEVLTAANTAFARGDNASAADLYQRVVNTPPNPGEAAALSTTLNDFAQFRDVVSLLALRRDSDARQQLDALQQRSPEAPFARLAAQLWDQYGMTGQLRAACAQIQPQVASQAGPSLQALQAAGVPVDPTSLCTPIGSA